MLLYNIICSGYLRNCDTIDDFYKEVKKDNFSLFKKTELKYSLSTHLINHNLLSSPNLIIYYYFYVNLHLIL